MKIIGVTGGIGSGKTQVLNYIKSRYHCEIIFADDVAHRLQQRGQPCYQSLVALLGNEILAEDGSIERRKMAKKIFSDSNLLRETNKRIHPAVKQYILTAIERALKEKTQNFLFIEAALLIEDGYADIVDELWYIYAREDVRRERLKQSRAYSDDKIDSILNQQLSEKEYKKYCRFIVDNSGSLHATYEQIDRKLEEYL